MVIRCLEGAIIGQLVQCATDHFYVEGQVAVDLT
jgi:hypothetical protein